MTESMTEGNPWKLILRFALPLLLGNLLQQTYNIVDAAIVGKYLGPDALASVGASSSVQFLVLGFCIGVCCGFGIPIAQRFGAGDYSLMRNLIFQSAVCTTVLAIVLTVLCSVFCPQILHLLSTPDNIFKGAYAYLFLIFLGIPFNLIYNLQAAILRAVGDSKTPFLFLAVSTVLNIILDLLCILVLHLGCAGAAIATVLAQAISGLLCLIYILKKCPDLKLSKADCRIHSSGISLLIGMGLPMGLQYSITAIGSMVMQSANNGLGSIYVSGFTAGMKIKQFAMCPFDAIATAVSTFCGQNLGAGKLDRVRGGLKRGVFLGVLYGLLAGLILIFAGRTLSLLFLSKGDVAVLDASAKYLRCMGFFFWSLGILNVFRMTTQSIGFSGRAILSGTLEMIARIAVSTVFVPLFGYTAICFADQAAWLSACFYIVPTCLACLRIAEKRLTFFLTL